MDKKVPSPEIELILFDLGGVLLELSGVPQMMEWTGYSMSVAALWDKWLQSPTVRAFETGKMAPDEFGYKIIEEFSIPVSPSDYLRLFTTWTKGPFPGTLDLLKSIQAIPIGCLSNTNELHWQRITTEMNILHLFTYHFASHLVGQVKPDQEIFLFAIKYSGIAPEKIVFLDDTPINVESAKNIGMQAYLVSGLDETANRLQNLGVIDSPMIEKLS